ncbi:hypothetical protein ABFT23_18390 [Nocardioides sp. C4-1]|uniref:hypothetical protein n=1 Tax=Nocardioides sp. C4-1 TaxID=3151851 RepID=UPI0032644438
MSLLDLAVLRRLPAVVVGCLAFAALGLVLAPLASAHPFGDPQTVEVTVDDGDVRLRWQVGGTDDLTALALALGLLPQDRVYLDGATIYEDGDGDLLAASPRLSEYLLDRVDVRAGGTDCDGELLPVTDLAADGAVLSFACGALADEAVVAVRTLTDLHPDYRTLATGPGGQRAVYDDDNPEHTWSLTGSPEAGAAAGSSAAVQLGSVAGLVVVGGAAGAFYVRRRGRRAEVPAG